MCAVVYCPLSEEEDFPFEGLAPPKSREVTFQVGSRYDRALLYNYNGLSGEIGWLWPGHIPYGRVTLIEGPAGAGKSLVALELAARLSDDLPWPDGAPQPRPGSKALILCRQDDMEDVVGARLEAMGANLDRCFQFHEFETIDTHEWLDIRPLALPFDIPALDHLLERDPAIRLLVVDALSDFCAGKGELAEALHRLNRLASERRVAIIATLRAEARFDRLAQVAPKSSFDTSAARCRWCCLPDPEDRRRLLFVPTQMNYAELPGGLAFRPGHNRIDWLDESIDPFDPIRKLSDCGQWLKDLLTEKDQHSKIVIGLGKEYGFSEGQVRRAFKEIGARQHRVGCQKGSRVMWSVREECGVEEECGVRNSECGIRDDEATAEGEGVPTSVDATGASTPVAEAVPVVETTMVAEPAAAASDESGSERQSAHQESAPAAPAPTSVHASKSKPDQPEADELANVGVTVGQSPDVDDLPWAGSPSSRLAPLSAMLDRPHNPNQLLRNLPDVKSMKSMQSRK